MIERWDDLRILLAVARGGTLTAASEALQVDPTTVTRRLKALEATVGLRLFDRLRGGVELTPAGDTLVATAEQWEAGLLDAERRLEGGREELSGAVRVALPELLAVPDRRCAARRVAADRGAPVAERDVAAHAPRRAEERQGAGGHGLPRGVPGGAVDGLTRLRSLPPAAAHGPRPVRGGDHAMPGGDHAGYGPSARRPPSCGDRSCPPCSSSP